MNFVREEISETDFDLLDFDFLNIWASEIPSRPAHWAIDRTNNQFLLPLQSDISDMRDGTGKCLFFIENLPIKLYITFGKPIKFGWTVLKNFDRSRIKEISSAAQNAIISLYDFDKSDMQFEVHDRWAPKSDTELAESFEGWASLTLASHQITWFTQHDREILAANKESKLKGILIKLKGRKPFDLKNTATRVAGHFDDLELRRIISYVKNSGYLLSKDAKCVLDAIQKFHIKGNK